MPAIYIHIPYCIHKCFYCDFYSIENLNSINKFVDLLCKEIKLYSKQIIQYLYSQTDIHTSKKINLDNYISTIFIGGGTPSLLRPRHLEKIIEQLSNNFNLSSLLEFTVECNPETVQLSVLKEYKALGVNRLSIGIQSFVESELKFLERTHNVHKAEMAIINARNAGFDNINIDLIFAIPGQSLKSWEYSLNKAISFKPDHIAAYSLIYEPDTPLHLALKNEIVKKTSDKLDSLMYYLLIDKMNNAGFIQYEVSNFALDGKKCLHNLNYWHLGSYYGFGPSAHGFVQNTRYWNYKNLKKYFDCLDNGNLPIQSTESIGLKESFNEYIMLGLRADGINTIILEEKYNLNLFNVMGEFISSLINSGKLKYENHIISLTTDGFIISDEIVIQILKRVKNL